MRRATPVVPLHPRPSEPSKPTSFTQITSGITSWLTLIRKGGWVLAEVCCHGNSCRISEQPRAGYLPVKLHVSSSAATFIQAATQPRCFREEVLISSSITEMSTIRRTELSASWRGEQVVEEGKIKFTDLVCYGSWFTMLYNNHIVSFSATVTSTPLSL